MIKFSCRADASGRRLPYAKHEERYSNIPHVGDAWETSLLECKAEQLLYLSLHSMILTITDLNRNN